MISSMTDIKENTASWSDKDWRNELKSWDKFKLLDAWRATMRSGQSHWSDEDWETLYHAEHCIYGEILERMGE